MREPMRWVLGAAMVAIGVTHFTNPEPFVSIMPPFLPWHRALVYLSGAIEVGLGLMLVVERTRNFAAWSLIALYVAVYPANLYMAFADVQMQGLPDWMPQPSPLTAWLRLPFQFLFMFWAYQYTDRARRRAAARRGA